MAKKVKLKQADIENIVKNIINEQQMSDDNISEPFIDDEDKAKPQPGTTLVKDADGNVYLLDNTTWEILHKF